LFSIALIGDDVSNFVDIYEHIFDQRAPGTLRAGAKNDTRSNLPSSLKLDIASTQTATRRDSHARRRGAERWYLIHTQAGRELQARMQLQILGFRTFLPQYIQTLPRTDQLRTTRILLFPSYVFVLLNLHRDRWRSIRSVRGIVSIVGTYNMPKAAPAGFVEALMSQAGDTSDSYSDFLALLDLADEAGRLRLLLEIMGSETNMTLPGAGFSPAA
jgi:hypothetical protein